MHLRKAVESAGGASAVAREFKISPVSVYEWIEKDRLPADRVIPLAKLANWEVTPHQLAPTLYPNASDGLPSQLKAA